MLSYLGIRGVYRGRAGCSSSVRTISLILSWGISLGSHRRLEVQRVKQETGGSAQWDDAQEGSQRVSNPISGGRWKSPRCLGDSGTALQREGRKGDFRKSPASPPACIPPFPGCCLQEITERRMYQSPRRKNPCQSPP